MDLRNYTANWTSWHVDISCFLLHTEPTALGLSLSTAWTPMTVLDALK